MNDRTLREYIAAVVAEFSDRRVPNQLISKSDKKRDKSDSEEAEEMEEMNVVANIAGFTGPLGAGASDMGAKPVKPGGKLKRRKKDFVRWK